MDRRKFIWDTCKLAGTLYLGVGIMDTFFSSAVCSAPNQIDSDPRTKLESYAIIKNNFKFGKMQRRRTTNQIVIHHTGIDKDLSALDVHELHLKNGWSGIGYHLFIRKDGVVETGRPLSQIGAHAYGHNKTTVGVCLDGNFNMETPTDAQLAAAAEVVAMLCRRYDLDPVTGVIVGHRELCDTDCPGNLFYPHLYMLRRNTAKLLSQNSDNSSTR